MWKAIVVVAALAACGKKDKQAEPPAKGSGSAVAVVMADAAPTPDAAPAKPSGPGYELAAANVPPPAGSLVGKEPPTAESLHLELAYALAKWAADPKDKSLYAKDFGGRDVADGRVDLVGYDEWMKHLPTPVARMQNPSIKTWLDPGTQLTLSEAKVNISYFYDGKDQYRELMWRREDKQWHLYKESTNSENHSEEYKPLRNWLPSDGKPIGKDVTARFAIENQFAWLVLENPTGAQVVVEIWPWGTCTQVEPPKPEETEKDKDLLGMLTCKDGGEGKDFTLWKLKDELALHLSPAGKDAPMSTDRTIDLAKGAKVTFKKP